MKKTWLAIGFVLVSVLIGLIFGGAIAGIHTLIPTLPQQIEDKINAISFCVLFRGYPHANYIYKLFCY